ncbi:MAG: metal-dependent hydrolase [Microthrixaceae bacterium]
MPTATTLPDESGTDTAATPPDRTAIPTRRIDFGFGEVDLPRHFMNGEILASHVVTVLSCLFPEGEDFFVRSVRNFRDQVTDPELAEQVRGFIGQEAIHGREHRAFNRALAELGYPVRFLDGRVRIGMGLLAKVTPARFQLAVTAALEHYTATLAEILLETELLDQDTQIEEVRELFYWHAVEENEHKAVAFDVLQQVSGSERLRRNVMRITTAGFLFAVVSGTLVSLATDPAARDISRLRSEFTELRENPILSRRCVQRIRDYQRRGFHPDDHDTTELLDRWTERLFGEKGRLRTKLRGPKAA